MSDLLVVAGEASGDRAGAAVLARMPGVRAFGMGGGALQGEGLELVADLRETTALGVAEVARRAYGVARAYTLLRAAVARRRPRAALLVNYTEFNARLAESLWASGTRVLWYGAPQVWAWRPGRAAPLRKHLDRMAVMLPFEEGLWRSVGVDAHYVGHPALEERRTDRVAARELLGMTPRAPAIAILPGSRPHEVRRLLTPMLGAYETVRRELASIDARVLLAPSLDDATRRWAADVAAFYQVDVVDVDARAGTAYAMPAFDAALCASGTASLECALARVVPIVCYRVGLATELGARALVTTPFVALPNVLLGRAAFPELLQRHATASRMTDALANVLEERDGYIEACDAVERALGPAASASRAVARMLEPWLGARASLSV
ncbi:MAG: lipid-A-disaccharide synthase [Labilithrix sp.]|nr:lipid-A-disaccharide synthase [Labilithrix sp.]